MSRAESIFGWRAKYGDSWVVLANSVGALVVRGLALVLSLLMMPAYLRYFGNQNILGLWFTVVSVASWVLTFDFGVGNGLRNYLVPVLSRRESKAAAELVSAAYIGMTVWVGLLGLPLLAACGFVDWSSVFKIPEGAVPSSAVGLSVGIVLAGMLLQLLLKISSSVLYAMQRSALNNFLTLTGSLLLYVYVAFGSPRSMATNLVTLALANAMAMNLPFILASVYLFFGPLREMRPRISLFAWARAKDVLGLGARFFWVQIVYLVIVGTDQFLINRLLGAGAVVEYQIYAKPFTVIGGLVVLALTPVWSAVTKAVSEERDLWLAKVYRSLLMLALAGTLLQLGWVAAMQAFVDVWLRSHSIQVEIGKSLAFFFYGSVLIWVAVLSTMANGLGSLRAQLVIYTIGAIVKIPLSWLLVGWFHNWVGVVLATAVSLGFFCLVQLWLFRALLRDSGVRSSALHH